MQGHILPSPFPHQVLYVESLLMSPAVLSGEAIRRCLGVSKNTASLLKRRLQLFLSDLMPSIKANIKEYVKEVTGMRGSSNCDDQVVHFGLGEYRGKVCVEIRWIGNKVQKIAELEINRRHKIFQDYIKDK